MNQPDRYARFVLPEGKQLVEYAKDTKISYAGTFTVRLEDHTLGNLVRQQLHTDPEVVFAGYRIPHPLDPLMVLRVQTTHRSSPAAAMLTAVRDLQAEVAHLRDQLSKEAPRDPDPFQQQQQQQQQFMGAARRGMEGTWAAGGYGGGQAYGGFPPQGGGYGSY